MIITTTNEWELSDKAGLVPVGSYSLFVSTRGPPRKSGAPVVIFITGGGAPTELYVHLHYAISKFARNYFYDRAGYGRSERPGSDDRCERAEHDCTTGAKVNNDDHGDHGDHAWWTPGGSIVKLVNDNDSQICKNGHSGRPRRKIFAEDNASELHRLMQAINVRPPYILAAHSYGGIVARTYYVMFPDDVAGMALLDTNSELLQQCLSPIPPPAYQKVIEHVDPEKITHLREESGMTDEEWEAAMAAINRTQPASADEATNSSGRQLARRMQIDQQVMGDKPLIVLGAKIVEEWRQFFEEGVKLGGGTKEEQREAEWWVESAELFWRQAQRVQLSLSRNAEYVDFNDVGHSFPISMPERTAKVVKKLLDEVKSTA